jgi:ATP-binding cassette subfamily B protein
MKIIYQHDLMDCGPACLAMICSNYGKNYSLQYLRDHSFLSKDGVNFSGINHAAENLGFETFGAQLTLDSLINEKSNLPAIIHWDKDHFVVLSGIKKNIFGKGYSFQIADPSYGAITLNEDSFKDSWLNDEESGLCLFLAPTEHFYEKEGVNAESISLTYILKYLLPYKKELFQLFLGLFLSTLITLIFPFLTQALIDKGVLAKNLNIITIILLAQISIFLGSLVIEVVRNWIVLYIGTRINISIISAFFKKMLSLPIRFFDTKMVGDINQRIQDHDRIERFLTSQSFITFFSIINICVFLIILLNYNYKILLVYASITIISIFWSLYFLKNRRFLDYFRFRVKTEDQDSIYELISGIQDLKLNNFEDYKRKEWEKIQIKLFGINLKVLKLDQLQLIGFDFLNQFKNIFVTFVAAREVILGNITLGTMLSITYIIGQMNSPINQLTTFFRSLQDARLSLERLNEIQNQEEEETYGLKKYNENNPAPFLNQHSESGFRISDLSFQYEGPKSKFVLKDINLVIPYGKTTAIVGESGSGKTTLMKILLKFYEPVSGSIHIGEQNLNEISPGDWRSKCGVVMQDGYIFGDTIKRNIATSDAIINEEKFINAINTANIQDFIQELPSRENTKIGTTGNGISGGQKQRMLIARAVYKDPPFIFFDEATSALDSHNEKIIHDNLYKFFKKKTVVIIAHRLSTVRNADQIVVLKDGNIIETGSHAELVNNRSTYFNLVKNQLELSV